MKYKFTYDSPIGTLWIGEENNKITHITIHPIEGSSKLTPTIQQAIEELDEYFKGQRQAFTFPIYYDDTPFRNKCYQALKTIPYGNTISYNDLAILINQPTACRAVGNAIHHNPLLIVIPCHRIIRKNGDIGGFGAGINIKKQLLEIERRNKI